MAPLPSGNQAAFHSLSAYGGSLYLFGGNTGGGVLSNALLVYDVGKEGVGLLRSLSFFFSHRLFFLLQRAMLGK